MHGMDIHSRRARRSHSSAATSDGSDRYGIRFPGCQICPATKLSGGSRLARRPVQMRQSRWGPRSSCRPRSRRARTCGSGRFPRATGPRRCGDLPDPVRGGLSRPRSQCTPTRKTSRPSSSVARYSRQAPNSMMCSTMRSFSRCRQRGQAPVEAIEEPRPHLLPPAERAVRIAPGGQHVTGHKMIRRHVQERFRQCLLHRPRQH
jgi:hypothetical protein